jgi:hypothetical protein
MNDLDAIIFDEIKKLAVDPDYYNLLCTTKQENSDEPNKIDILKKEIGNVREQISRFMDLYGLGQFTIEQVSSKVEPLNDQLVALERELESLNATNEVLSEEDTLELATSFAEVLERGDLDEIRLTLESLIYYIELDEDDVYIHWKFC